MKLGSDPKQPFGVRPQPAIRGQTPIGCSGSDPDALFGARPQARPQAAPTRNQHQHPATKRLKPATFHILASLAGEARHGLGIIRDVLEQTGGELQLWPANLYGALEQLVADGLIEELGAHERPAGESEKRRYYRLTRAGRSATLSEVKRLEQLAAMARGRLAPGTAKAR